MADVRPPAGLGGAGRALWRRLTPGLEFSTAELVTLELACRQADDVARLEHLLEDEGMVTTGSKGQQRLSGVPAELRQQRYALNRLVSALALPDLDEVTGRSPAQRKATKAAAARWDRVGRLKAAGSG